MAKKDKLNHILLFSNDKFKDKRGELYTIWKSEITDNLNFNHDKIAVSHKNVLRGLHTDKSWKLITCLFGKIQFVVVNFNKLDTDYLNYTEYILDSEDEISNSILVPPYYLNGHLVLSDKAIFHYKWSYDGNYPDVNEQITVNAFDPKLGIKWLTDTPIRSERDEKAKLL